MGPRDRSQQREERRRRLARVSSSHSVQLPSRGMFAHPRHRRGGRCESGDATSHPETESLQQQPWMATPQILPVPGCFSDGYDWRRHPITGKRTLHRGLDSDARGGE